MYIGWNKTVIKPVDVSLCEPAIPQAAQLSGFFTEERWSSSIAVAGAT
jgi:hypothetical protein